MQPLDPAGVYTNAAVIAALTGANGTRTMSFRFDRLNSANTFVEAVDFVVGGTVTNNALADVKRTAKFRVLDRTGVDYLKDRLKPWARLSMPDGGFVEWPLGVFILATPGRVLDTNGLITRDVEAYDQLLSLKQDIVTDRYTVAAGTAYTTAIATLTGGFTSIITASSLTLPAALEWAPGVTKLRILNDLLAAINYESAWFDELGRLICRPYLAPSSRSAEYAYTADSLSVITGNVEQSLDLYSVPNKWVLVKSEADQASIKGTYTNANPASPTSTVSRGRTIVDFRVEQEAADQATIDAKAARLAFEASQVFESIKFSTLLMPMHSNADVISLSVPGLGVSDKFTEHTWELPLAAGARMSHTVRRVVNV
jgi:hypothetical protein